MASFRHLNCTSGRSPGLAVGVVASAAVVIASAFPISSAFAQSLAPLPAEDRAQAVECLTLAVAYEAGYESEEGQQAVAEVVLNRVRNPVFPKSVCNVVFAGSTRKTGCQFSFTCDGSLRRRLPDAILAHARVIAEQAMDGLLPPLVRDATSYHATYVSPYWAPTLERVRKIGAHIFYRRPDGASSAALTDLLGTRPAAPALPPAAARTPFTPWGLAPPMAATAASTAPPPAVAGVPGEQPDSVRP